MHSRGIWMQIRGVLIYPQCPFVMCNCLIVLALTVVRQAEVVNRGGRIDVIHSECLLKDPQRTFILCDRLIVLALTRVRQAEVVNRGGRINVIPSECLLKDPQRTFIL